MDHVLPFLRESLFLVVPFCLVLAIYLWVEFKLQGGGAMVISPQEFVLKMNEKLSQVIDIRKTTDHQLGHIVGSLSCADLSESALSERLKAHKKHNVLVVCYRGISAQKTASSLQKLGFEKVFVLAGGMEAWRRDNMPVMTGADAR